MRYSDHFDSKEFAVSRDYPDVAASMEIPGQIIEAHKWGSVYVLEKVRIHVSAWRGEETPLIITSAYRSKELNLLIGGHPKSHHMTGHALDVTFEGISRWHNEAMMLPEMITCLQYILIYPDQNFWHLGFPPEMPFNKYWRIMQ